MRERSHHQVRLMGEHHPDLKNLGSQLVLLAHRVPHEEVSIQQRSDEVMRRALWRPQGSTDLAQSQAWLSGAEST